MSEVLSGISNWKKLSGKKDETVDAELRKSVQAVPEAVENSRLMGFRNLISMQRQMNGLQICRIPLRQ